VAGLALSTRADDGTRIVGPAGGAGADCDGAATQAWPSRLSGDRPALHDPGRATAQWRRLNRWSTFVRNSGAATCPPWVERSRRTVREPRAAGGDHIRDGHRVTAVPILAGCIMNIAWNDWRRCIVTSVDRRSYGGAHGHVSTIALHTHLNRNDAPLPFGRMRVAGRGLTARRTLVEAAEGANLGPDDRKTGQNSACRIPSLPVQRAATSTYEAREDLRACIYLKLKNLFGGGGGSWSASGC
jgi:hypothetical protein